MSFEDDMQLLIDLHMAGADEAVLSHAVTMDQAGIVNPVHAAILSESAFRTGHQDAARRGIGLIVFLIGADPEAARILDQFSRDVLMPRVPPIFAAGANDTVMGYLEIARRTMPEIGACFPLSPGRRPRMIAAGTDKRMTFPGRKDAVRPRRVLFFMRKFYFGPDSREHDFGPRMARGFERGGWSCVSLDPAFDGREQLMPGADDMMEHVRRVDADLLLIDFCGLAVQPGALVDMIRRCRRERPDTRVAIIHFDPWQRETWSFSRLIAEHVDLFWTSCTTPMICHVPEIRDKLSVVPFPVGIALDELPVRMNAPRTAFQGAVESYNASRAFWLSACANHDLSVDVRLTGHSDDGIPALDSYRRYLGGFMSADRLLNFSMRQDGSRIITGRTFEAIYTGACLIQEDSDDLETYFRPGEDLLAFSDFEELTEILRAVEADPDWARSIGRNAQARYLAEYDDPMIVAHLDLVLFGN